MPSRLRYRKGQMYIVETEDGWQRDSRTRVIAWLTAFLLGAIFWTVVFCAVLG